MENLKNVGERERERESESEGERERESSYLNCHLKLFEHEQ